MATFLDEIRDELYNFFESDIVPLIRKEKHTPELLASIKTKFEAKFVTKYHFLVKSYDNTIRISATYIPLGIVFFMADTKHGKNDYEFCDPCYWGK